MLFMATSPIYCLLNFSTRPLVSAPANGKIERDGSFQSFTVSTIKLRCKPSTLQGERRDRRITKCA